MSSLIEYMRVACVVLIGLLASTGACAQDAYPNRVVRMVVPFASGGGTDILGRLLAAKLSEMYGKQVIVDNRAGASGSLGSRYVVDAAPDGYTLLLTTQSSLVAFNLLHPPKYDPVKDFAHIGLISREEYVLIVPGTLPVRSVKEFIEYAKAQPGKLNYSSTGAGSVIHLGMELLKLSTGTNIVHVPYPGASQSMVSVLTGESQVTFVGPSVADQQIKSNSGKLRVLAIASRARSPVMPDVPTMAESGYPDIEVESSVGMLAPVATPAAIINKLNGDVRRILVTDDIKNRLQSLGYRGVGSTPDEYVQSLVKGMAVTGRVIREANIKAD